MKETTPHGRHRRPPPPPGHAPRDDDRYDGPVPPLRAADTPEVTTDVAISERPAGDPRARDRRAFSRARAILSDLALLQSGLLAGTTDALLLRRLAGAGPTPADDPRLADLLAHASLRAQVELARREPRS